MFGNPDQSSHNILLGTQCQTSVSLNVNHGSNDKRFPSQITDVKSLKKAKVNTSKIHSSASDNSGLNTWMKVKTNCEVIHEPLCLERSTVSDNCESKNIRNLKIDKLTNVIDNGMVEMVNLPAEAISVPEVLPQRSKKRSIECPDVLSSAMKSARIDEGSQASDTIVITVPNGAQMAESSTTMSLAIDNEFIMIDDVNRNQSEFNNKEKEPTVSANDDFIVFKDKTIEQKKQKMNTLFTCKKCSFKGNTLKIIISHVKTVHNAEQNVDCEDSLYKITPEITSDTNNSVNFLMPQHNEQQNASLKRKSSTNFGNQKGSPKAKPIVKNQSKTMFFSPDTIDSIPKCHIFSDLINCLLCTYSTRVRSNLVIHLNRHTKGQDNTTKEIVNPVPSIGKCELMFDKMINLSANAFDAMNTENIKRDELDQKIVEVAPDDTLNTEIFPKFIPKNMLYKCSVIHCTYTGKTKDMLKKHTSILHPTHECYICPHCLPLCNISKLVEQNQIEFHLMHHGANLYRCQYCEYIHFNRVEMRTHMRNTHLSDITSSIQSNIIVIRQTMLEDDSIDRATFNVPQWVCNICSNGLRYSENEITSHILMAHKISNMFKCPMCQFEHENDNANIFKEHYKSKHPSVAVKCFRVFEKISDKEELHKQSEHLGGTENMLRQQALESIEPTLVPLTVRGIPIEFTPLKTTSVESSKAIIVDSKRTSYSTTKEKNIEREKKAFISHPIHEPVSNDDIISLVDDSDDE